jgi:hypothetical protein
MHACALLLLLLLLYTLLQSTMDDSREKLKQILQVNPNWQPDNPDDELKVHCAHTQQLKLSAFISECTTSARFEVGGLMQSD